MANIGEYGNSIKKNIDFPKRRKYLLWENEKTYRALFENMGAAFAIHEMIYDQQGNPSDYRFLDINPAFEKLTGFKASTVIGKTVKQVFPNTEQYWIDIYGKVARTGTPVSFQNYAKELGRFYDVWAFCPAKDQFGVIFTDITERKKAEDALREAHDKLAATLEAIPDLMFEVDLTGCVYDYHTEKNTPLYLPSDRFLEKKIADIFPQNSVEIIMEALTQAGKQGWHRGSIFELDFSGAKRWFELSIASKGDYHLPNAHFIAIVRDITARKVAEQELQETKERLHYLLRITKTGIDIIDEDFNLVYIDPMWQTKYGVPAGRKCYEYFRGSSSICPSCGIPRALETKQIIVSEEVCVKEKNRVIEVHNIPFKDSRGKWLVAEFNLDITERRRAEEALRESEDRYRHIFEKASDLIILTDPNNYIINISPSVKRILEFEPGELIGKKMWEVGGAQLEKWDKLMEIPCNIDNIVPITLQNYEVRSKTGRKVIFDIMVTPIIKDGQLIAINSIAREVTQQREIELEREALLEKTIQISDLKSNLITQAADALKTPLTVILGWGDVLYAAKKQGKSLDTTFDLEDIESIVRNAERLNGLINDFLDGGRIDSGKFEINKQSMDFIEIIENATRAVNYLAAQKDITFIADMAPSIQIPIDRRRMEQVIINLLSNAIKYSPERTCVTIKTGTVDIRERKMFQVQVIDEGYGFTPEELVEAMTPFGRVHTQQKQKQGVPGTGLGLFIGRSIVEEHGGTLVIRSEGVNKGTQVEILLPLG